jgi:hypothetical protein
MPILLMIFALAAIVTSLWPPRWEHIMASWCRGIVAITTNEKQHGFFTRFNGNIMGISREYHGDICIYIYVYICVYIYIYMKGIYCNVNIFLMNKHRTSHAN